MMAGRKMEWPGGQRRLSRRDLTIVATRLSSPKSRQFVAWKSAQPGPSRRARSDRWDAPKGQKDSAQGFNPGLRVRTMRPESGARAVKLLPRMVERIVRSRPPKSGATFRAHAVKTRNPGLKPWAESLCPFGACTDRRPRKRGRSTFLIFFP
jgi:hypothetical protein